MELTNRLHTDLYITRSISKQQELRLQVYRWHTAFLWSSITAYQSSLLCSTVILLFFIPTFTLSCCSDSRNTARNYARIVINLSESLTLGYFATVIQSVSQFEIWDS